METVVVLLGKRLEVVHATVGGVVCQTTEHVEENNHGDDHWQAHCQATHLVLLVQFVFFLLGTLGVFAKTLVDVFNQGLNFLCFQGSLPAGVALPKIQRKHEQLQKHREHNNSPSVVANPAVHPTDKVANKPKVFVRVVENVGDLLPCTTGKQHKG